MCGLLSKLPRRKQWHVHVEQNCTHFCQVFYSVPKGRVRSETPAHCLHATKREEVLSRNVHPFSNVKPCIFHRATVAIVLFGGGSDLSCICGLPFAAAGRSAASRSAAASSSAAAAPTATVTRGNCTPSCNGKKQLQHNISLWNSFLAKVIQTMRKKTAKKPTIKMSSQKSELTKLTASASGAQFSSVCGLPKTRSCK